MRQIIPFTKEITFKTTIGELVSISLDHDIVVKDDLSIKGNFYLKGSYKILKSNIDVEKFSYKIPCEIDIAGNYDLKDATLEIDDFNYDVLDDVLKIDVKLLVDNLEEVLVVPKEELVRNDQNIKELEINRDEDIDTTITRAKDEIKEYILEDLKEDVNSSYNNDYSNMFNLSGNDETYLTYYVYIYQEDDTIESILNKYNISKYELMEYNDLEDIKIGSKLIIPSKNA